MKCEQRVWRGPRAGQVCGRTACMIVVEDGSFTCGVHARAWVRRALARIAYYNPRTDAWL